MNIGTKIMNLRKEKHFTQPYLAELLGISYMTVRRWETGKSKPSLDQINHLAEVLNVPAQYLIGFTDNPEPKTALTHDIQALADGISNEDIDLEAPITGGFANNMYIINDKNTNRVYYLPNNEEGRKLFLSVLTAGIQSSSIPTVSNSINGDNNSNNKLGTTNS